MRTLNCYSKRDNEHDNDNDKDQYAARTSANHDSSA